MTHAQKVAYYRQRCLACHEIPGAANKPSFSSTHHSENQECVACHMQRATSTDIAHEQVTDHRIVVRFSGKVIPPATSGPLVAVGSTALEPAADDRDLGLAYAQMAARGDRTAFNLARMLLGRAALTSQAAQDAELHAQLGFLDQVAGQNADAAREYRLALAADPYDSFSAGNLALIRATSHDARGAILLWSRALAENPAEPATGINLAIVECGLGARENALATLNRILEFAPDNRQALGLQLSIRSKERSCGR
uniref:Tetratricopeptide repeat protein n=1 Tax=mine drainage metagenome TaxID=410659 RepID=E6QNB9_9ZZZZ